MIGALLREMHGLACRRMRGQQQHMLVLTRSNRSASKLIERWEPDVRFLSCAGSWSDNTHY
jgi:hypothetical protein